MPALAPYLPTGISLGIGVSKQLANLPEGDVAKPLVFIPRDGIFKPDIGPVSRHDACASFQGGSVADSRKHDVASSNHPSSSDTKNRVRIVDRSATRIADPFPGQRGPLRHEWAVYESREVGA